MNSTPFIVATAGHVDHGKSALVQALTGTDPDRLPEEKLRGITIDLGFAHLELPRAVTPGAPPPTEPATLSVGLIDVPGHEDFVKNMVAGVGSIDAALLIVAADDGWMPQTEEHLQILGYLGVRHAVVALTKADLVAGREGEIAEQIRAELAGTPFSAAPIVPTSALDGRGLPELASCLAKVLSALPAPADLGKPRLPIDRTFTLRGIGTVVTGTLSGGVFRRNQSVVLQPLGQASRIRTLQTHHREVDSVAPGSRTALNLPDLVVGGDGQNGVTRGQVATIPELGGPTHTLDVLLERSSRAARRPDEAARRLKHGATVRLHHGSVNILARVAFLNDEPLDPGARVLAQLRLEQPLFALAGDRFILRDSAQRHTVAGGLILDADAQRRFLRTEVRRAFLQARAAAPDDPCLWAITQLRRDHARPQAGFLQRTRFSEQQIAQAMATLAAAGQIVVAGDQLLDPEWLGEIRTSAVQLIQTEHRQHPERTGLSLRELRAFVEPRLPAPGLFEVFVRELRQHGFEQVGTAVRQASHRPALPPSLQAAGAKLRAALAAKPFEPPTRKELAPDPLTQQALRFLLETGEAIEVSPELIMLQEHFGRARDLVCQALRQRGPASASDLRQTLGTSRRVIIPLLERLDRDGVTARQGDQRVLRAQ